jgi:PadR family transcriptional regulator PadR
MPDDVRLSKQTLAVLTALLRSSSTWHYGYALSQETQLKSGSLYPILVRLAEQEWLETRWEYADETGKPRHMYRLTAEGRRAARAAVQERAFDLNVLHPAFRRR